MPTSPTTPASRFVVALLALALVAIGGCYPYVGRAYVRRAPPRAAYRASVPPPYANAVWVEGHYEWIRGDYVWIDGYWMDPRPGYVWAQPRWDYTVDGYVYVPGVWVTVR